MERLIELYAKLYAWHKNIGKGMYLEKFPSNTESKYFFEYLSFLDSMQHPDDVEIQFIKLTAKHQLSGLLEWSYGEKFKNEIPLNKIAHEIVQLLEEQDLEKEKEDIDDKFEGFSNVATNEASVVEIELPKIDFEEYITLSKKAYSDIPISDENLGGFNLVADTNWEYNKHYLHNVNSRIIKFFNANALHFKEITDKNTISSMVKDGTIKIESIKIG